MADDAYVQRLLAQLEADAHAEYETAVERELARLDGLGLTRRNLKLRRSTILALAAAEGTDKSWNDVLGQADTVSRATFYARRSTWYSGEGDVADLFRDVLASVLTLTRQYNNGAALRRQTAEREAWVARMRDLTSKAAERIDIMLSFPLSRKVTRTSENGRTVVNTIEPADWNYSSLARLLAVVDKSGRLARGLFTDETRQELTGRDGGPVALRHSSDFSGMSDDELDDALTRLLAQMGTQPEGTAAGSAAGEGEAAENGRPAAAESGEAGQSPDG